jgi:hypothetical protein
MAGIMELPHRDSFSNNGVPKFKRVLKRKKSLKS